MSLALFLLVAVVAVSSVFWPRLFFLMLAAGACYMAWLAALNAAVMAAGLLVTNAIMSVCLAFAAPMRCIHRRIPSHSQR